MPALASQESAQFTKRDSCLLPLRCTKRYWCIAWFKVGRKSRRQT